ncbi:MAG: hypothetical protein EA338_11170 [Roseinatronobacter sp.]|nr:MAG: hypothetical protein EA338_11170 [Roseinatronobacter sp.]
MAGGPLGMAQDEQPYPLWHAVAALSALAGAHVTITHSPSGLTLIRGRGRRGIAGVAANLGPDPIALDFPACAIPENGPWDWIERCAPGEALTLGAGEAAILKEEAA